MAWTGEGGTHVFQGSAWEAVRRGTPLTPGWASFTHLQPLTSTGKKQELNKEFSLSETMRKLSPHVLDVNTPHPPCWNSSYGEYPKKKKKGNRINEELLQYGWIILSELGHHCPPFCEFFQKWLSYSAITWRINPNCISCYYDISIRNTGAVAIVL